MKRAKTAKRRKQSGEEDNPEEENDPETFDMNPTAIIVFVVLMCVMLISLYFFYDYLGTFYFIVSNTYLFDSIHMRLLFKFIFCVNLVNHSQMLNFSIIK